MIRRLHLRIYLTTLASLAVVVIVCALLWRFTAERSAETEHDRILGTLISQALPDDAPVDTLEKSLAALVAPPVAGLSLFDRGGTQVASAGDTRGVDEAMRHGQTRNHDGMALHAIRLGDGRVLVARMQLSGHAHLHALGVLAIVALAVAVVTYPVVRRLTRRLEMLAASVDQFGSGQLAVRAPVSGKDEVANLSSTFNRMAERIANLVDAHRRMLANASHELRSPLARVRLALDLYEGSPRPELLQEMRRDCAEIDEQIEEILLASKLDTIDAAFTWENVDLSTLIAEESARLGVPFDVVPAEVRGDTRLLRKMIRNLVENACKHGGLDVAASIRVDDAGQRILEVSDRGAGIPENERERIFEPFYRPGSARESGSGWGLGLSLVKQIADRHGGSVRCVARAGGGCTFEVVLPALPA